LNADADFDIATHHTITTNLYYSFNMSSHQLTRINQ